MKTAYSIILILCFSFVCKAQNERKTVSDTMAMVSRNKADAVLKHFDTIKAPKILYSLEDKYYYLIIKDTPCYKEYYVALDSLSRISKILSIKVEEKNRKQRKQQEQYRKLLSKAEPIFDLSKYHTHLITQIPDAKMEAGRPSYFVVKDIDGKRYGEYSLSSLTVPFPINTNLWAYLVKKLSDEIALDIKTSH
ncbi:MAG: hypothetical protein LBI73_09700 [Myroides sp.]|jgi:hypothetical protein|nr:hypothetical protein [Myroides sp.]